jgi:hypothetical protein
MIRIGTPISIRMGCRSMRKAISSSITLSCKGTRQEAKKLQALVEKKVKKASKNQIKEPVDGADQPADGNDADDDDDEEGDGQVNLEDWITGRDNYPWQDVSNAILARYSKRVTSQAEGVAFLVDEKLVPAEQVAKRYRKYL